MSWVGGPDLSVPSDQLELMDGDHADERDLREAYDDIAVSNRLLGGHAASIGACADLIRAAARAGRSPVTVLDVGGGGGDTAAALSAWCRTERIAVRILCTDLSPIACRHARVRRAADPWIRVQRADAFALPSRSGADVVHAALFLHHVPRPRQAELLAALAGLADVGVAVVDLHRTAWAWHGIRLFGAVTGRGRLFRNDAPLSVARGFSRAEAAALAEATGLEGWRLQLRPAARLTWVRGPSDGGGVSRNGAARAAPPRARGEGGSSGGAPAG